MPRTVYPPQAVRQVILAVDRLIARGDITEVAGLLHTIWWKEGLKGKQAVVAIHLRWYICQREKQYIYIQMHKNMQPKPEPISLYWM